MQRVPLIIPRRNIYRLLARRSSKCIVYSFELPTDSFTQNLEAGWTYAFEDSSEVDCRQNLDSVLLAVQES